MRRLLLLGLVACGPKTFDGDCDKLPRVDPNPTEVTRIPLSEDFDFTADGQLVHVEQGNLVRRTLKGDPELISPNVTAEASGTRVLPDGDVLVADVAGGQLWLVDAETGARSSVLAAAWPNGLALDSQGWVFVSDFVEQGRILHIDPRDPSNFEIVAEGLERPNGLALSTDENTLYVALTWNDQVLRIERTAAGWSEPRELVQGTGSAQTLAVDTCDNLYMLGQGQLFRWDGEDLVEVAMTEGYTPSLRFGVGEGGFAADKLYGLSDGGLWEYAIGVPGG